MIGATLVRAIVLSAAFAGFLTPVYGDQLSAKATQKPSSELLSLLQQKRISKHSPILLRVFKEESELEVWKQDNSGHFQVLKVYPICRWSGDIGPKLHEGDRQAPEGFYTITPEMMNPNSNFYLAINTGFPNTFDKANDRDGTFLMIHGDCLSSGCYAMTDEQIGEIYWLARSSFLAGQQSFQIQAYPFRLTPANLARHRTNPHMSFWKMLKIGNDHFEATHLEPKVEVCDRRYVFDPQHPPNSSKPLLFDPTGKCPTFVVDPKIARLALKKQQADEVEYAQLVKDNMAVAPINSGLDGGMNKVFLAQFPGSIIPLARVLPAGSQLLPQLQPVPYADNRGSVTSRLFDSVFGWKPSSQTQTLPLIRSTLEGGSQATPATQIETVASKPASSKPSINEAAQNDTPKTEAQ